MEEARRKMDKTPEEQENHNGGSDDDDDKKPPAKNKEGKTEDEASSSQPSLKRKRQGKSEKNNHQERWEEMYSRLTDFYNEHGHSNVPNRYSEDPQLGSWVSAQRRAYKTITSGSSGSTAMTLERATKLLQLGFEWEAMNPNNVSWDTRYAELKAFVKTYGHANVPMRWKENVQLSNWVSKQRHDYKLLERGASSRLSEKRMQLLNDLGFVWEVERGSSIVQMQRVSVVGLPTRKSRKPKNAPDSKKDDDDQESPTRTSSEQRTQQGQSSSGGNSQQIQQQQSQNLTSTATTGGASVNARGNFFPLSTSFVGVGLPGGGQTLRPGPDGTSSVAMTAGGSGSTTATQETSSLQYGAHGLPVAVRNVVAPGGGGNISAPSTVASPGTQPYTGNNIAGPLQGEGTGSQNPQQHYQGQNISDSSPPFHNANLNSIPHQQQQTFTLPPMLPFMQQQQAPLSTQQGMVPGAPAPPQFVILALPSAQNGNIQGNPMFANALATLTGGGSQANNPFTNTSSISNTNNSMDAASLVSSISAAGGFGANNANNNLNYNNNSTGHQLSAAWALIASALASASSNAAQFNAPIQASGNPLINNIATALASMLGAGGLQQVQQQHAPPPWGSNVNTASFGAAPSGGGTTSSASDNTQNSAPWSVTYSTSNTNQMHRVDPMRTLAALLGGVGSVSAAVDPPGQQQPPQLQLTAQSIAAALAGANLHANPPANAPLYNNPNTASVANLPFAFATNNNTVAQGNINAAVRAPTAAAPVVPTVAAPDHMTNLAAALSQFFQSSAATVTPQAQSIPGTITVTSTTTNNSQPPQQEEEQQHASTTAQQPTPD